LSAISDLILHFYIYFFYKFVGSADSQYMRVLKKYS
jgi:hypothetical protein